MRRIVLDAEQALAVGVDPVVLSQLDALIAEHPVDKRLGALSVDLNVSHRGAVRVHKRSVGVDCDKRVVVDQSVVLLVQDHEPIG